MVNCEIMKALRVYGAKDIRLENVPRPAPGSDDVLVRVKAVGICGSDRELYECTQPFIVDGLTTLPIIPGHEWSGEVVEIGLNTSDFEIGDRVVGECSVGCGCCSCCLAGQYHLCTRRTETGILRKDGAFAEYICFPARFLHRENGCSFDSLSMTEPTAVALYAVKTARITPADTVVIMGPGPIGLQAVQCAKAYGARHVVLTGTRDNRLKLGKELGADETVNIRSESLTEIVADLAKGVKASVVIEAAGHPSVWSDILSVAAPQCRIVLTGLFSGRDCPVDFTHVVINNLSVTGCVGSPNVWSEALGLIRTGRVQTESIITHRMHLKDFEKGLELMADYRSDAIKVVLHP